MAILQNYIEGNTRLNKLKYGDSATIGNEPIVQKTIPTSVNQKGPSSNAISKRVDDLKRIGLLLTQKPGLKWIANETALNASQVEFKTKQKADGTTNVLGTALNAIGANLFNSVKIIGSTLAQVPLNGTGTHFVKGFAGTGPRTYLSEQNLINDVAPHVLARNGSPILADNTWATPTEVVAPRERENSNKQEEIGKTTKFKPADQKGIPVVIQADKSVRKETRVLLGDAGSKKRNISDSYAGDNDLTTQDKINLLAPYKQELVKGIEETRDLIKFRFNIITPEDNTFLHFRAYLDSFSDNFSGNWNTFNYIGRGESFNTYQGFSRGITLGFKIAAQSRWEMRPLYQKIVTLASSTAPTYSGQGFMRGTFVELTVGDYIFNQPGFITSVTYNIQSDYQWEIARNNPEAKIGANEADFDQQELPMVLDCQVNFTPIHRFTPQTGLYHYITTGTSFNPENLFFTQGTNSGPGELIAQPKVQ